MDIINVEIKAKIDESHFTAIQDYLEKNSTTNLGIDLLLFSIGLKLKPKVLLQKKVAGTTLSHMGLMTLIIFALLVDQNEWAACVKLK